MRAFLLLLCLGMTIQIYAQILPPSRSANWEQAGCRAAYPQDLSILNILDFGAVADGSQDVSFFFNQALQALENNPGVIYFPEGTYLFQSSIHVPSHTILRGHSAQTTTLIFNTEEEEHLVNFEGERSSTEYNLIQNVLKDQQEISIIEDHELNAGDYIYIIDNDVNKVWDEWALESTGQVVQINAINNGVLQLASPLRRRYSIDLDAKIFKIDPVREAGVESLSIQQENATVNKVSNIYFEYAADCWVKCIESSPCNFAHVDVRMSMSVDVSGSYFHHAFDYGGGGRAYGVLLHFGTSECLVQNNIFNTLRHAMIVQAGANGNVFAYNYSTTPYWTGVSGPSDAAGDLVIHGNFPYTNLFEGNILQNLVIDNSHGVNGPFNTFFRNRVELYGIFMNINPVTDSQNFIGNEITNNGFLLGNYAIEGDDHFEFGNNNYGSILPQNTTALSESSLFVTESPDYLDPIAAWPPIGIPNTINTSMITAQERFATTTKTVCGPAEISTGVEEKFIGAGVMVYPNPTTDQVQLFVGPDREVLSIALYNSSGFLVFKSPYEGAVDLSPFQSGLYSLQILLDNNALITKKIIKL